EDGLILNKYIPQYSPGGENGENANSLPAAHMTFQVYNTASRITGANGRVVFVGKVQSAGMVIYGQTTAHDVEKDEFESGERD
ncbi:hypothetical protein AX17_004884, partial [Amanita inopinata Kibby_2008]